MILYHFTSVKWLESIVADGVIKVTDSNLAGPTREQVGKVQARLYASRWTMATEPKVVWLSSVPEVDATYLGMITIQDGRYIPIQAHMTPIEYRKTRVRITVSVPDGDALWWPQWARRMKMNERWYQHMVEGHRSPKEWYVVQRPIPLEEITKIELDDSQVWPGTGKLSRLDAVKKWLGRK